MRAALGFFPENDRTLDSRLGRRRWRQAVPAPPVELDPGAPAHTVFPPADLWVLVRDSAAIPLGEPRLPSPGAKRVLVAARPDLDPPFAHTLRELEGARASAAATQPTARCAAFAFRPPELPSEEGETVERYVERLLAEPGLQHCDGSFLAFDFEDPSEAARPELTRLLPFGRGRLLDVGCGRGGAVAGMKQAGSPVHATGIEKNPAAVRRAEERLDRVIAGDAMEALDRLVSDGESFDRFLFGDVLEHLTDPTAALARARALAAKGAVLVATVPNVGHLSIVRDLLLGRFDPVPAGLCDSGHLRWFTKASLAEAIEEAGWTVDRIASIPGAPAPDAADFLRRLGDWPGVDRESLETYQWLAVAHAE